jgi:hypothetical protein
MRQTGHWKEPDPLTEQTFRELLIGRVKSVDVEQIKREVEPFVSNPAALEVWSREFFLDIVKRIKVI